MQQNLAKLSNTYPFKITPVILCGGSGTRLWPLSRHTFPKPFCSLVDDETLFSKTIHRFTNPSLYNPMVIVCHQDHKHLVEKELKDQGITHYHVLIEPMGKNTLPALTISCLTLEKLSRLDDYVLVVPSDHWIPKWAHFENLLIKTLKNDIRSSLLTFGILPTAPETGYGYIHYNPAKFLHEHDTAHAVSRFVEKPKKELAQQFVDSNEYLWNSGLFLAKARVFLDACEELQSELFNICTQAFNGDTFTINPTLYGTLPDLSIDYGLMEVSADIGVVPFEGEWFDLGHFNALWSHQPKDTHGNILKGDIVTMDVNDSYVHSTSSRLVTLVGVDDLVVIDSEDALLVTSQDQCQNIKVLVDHLKHTNRPQAKYPAIMQRPWGTYQSLSMGDRFQVKKIVVYPKQELSLQHHHHRAEQWVIVQGTAVVTLNQEQHVIHEGQTIHIPCMAKHRIANPGQIPLIFIEVQYGSYLGEDDIVRHEDHYGRAHKTAAANH